MWKEEAVEQPWRDPIVEEIRRIRAAHAARFNYSVRAIVEDARRKQDLGNREVVSFPPRRPLMRKRSQS